MEIVVLDGYTENPGDLSWDAVKSFGTLTVYDRTRQMMPLSANGLVMPILLLPTKRPSVPM